MKTFKNMVNESKSSKSDNIKSGDYLYNIKTGRKYEVVNFFGIYDDSFQVEDVLTGKNTMWNEKDLIRFKK